MTHLLDTSAILAHLLDEPGADQVSSVLAGGREVAALAAPSWVELARRLNELIDGVRERERLFRHYTRDLCALVPLDESATRAAIRIQEACPGRLPLVDALIAGCAAGAGLILVHRDAHYDAIPSELLNAVRLPDKTN